MKRGSDEANRLELALDIISDKVDFSDRDFALLGYDIYKLRELGRPSPQEIRGQAVRIVHEAILGAYEKQGNPSVDRALEYALTIVRRDMSWSHYGHEYTLWDENGKLICTAFDKDGVDLVEKALLDGVTWIEAATNQYLRRDHSRMKITDSAADILNLEHELERATEIVQESRNFHVRFTPNSRIRISLSEQPSAWYAVLRELKSGRWMLADYKHGQKEIDEYAYVRVPPPVGLKPIYILCEATGAFVGNGTLIDGFNSLHDALKVACERHKTEISDLMLNEHMSKQGHRYWDAAPHGEAGFNAAYIRIVEITPKNA